MAPDGEQAEMIRKRKFPLVGSGAGIVSMLHMDDLATGTLAAIEHGKPGEIYNIVDDEPAPVREWLPFLAQRARRAAAAQGSRVAREAGRQPGRGGDDDRGPRRFERQGQARTQLDAEPPHWREGIAEN